MINLAYLLHCIIMLSAHAFAYLLGHVESEFEESTEQAQVKAITNLVWAKTSLGALTNVPCLLLYFESYFMFYYDCALSL
jgi:hypothetical protein